MEVWKEISGYENMYAVSNQGRVVSLNRVQKDKNGRIRKYAGKILIPHPNSCGYLRVQLNRDGKMKSYFIHRLVALHFVENPSESENNVVNHLDSNFLNNNADNLEWTTHKGNAQHAKAHGRLDRTPAWLQHLRESHEKNGRSVIGTSLYTGKSIYFICLNDSRTAGFNPSCVCACCKGERKTHKGYSWRYA